MAAPADDLTPFDHAAALAACARGDRAALRRLYDVEARQMLGVALRIVRQRSLAEDVVHDAFISVWEKAASFDPRRGAARGWLYSVVRHRALNQVRDHMNQRHPPRWGRYATAWRSSTSPNDPVSCWPMSTAARTPKSRSVCRRRWAP